MKIELVMDIGSKFITVYKKDGGIIMKEPCVVLVGGDRKKVDFTASGKNALDLMNKNENNQTIYPIKCGAIAHEKGAIYMFADILSKIAGERAFFKPRVSLIACISCGLTNLEKSDVEKCLNEAGFGDVTMIESPVAVSQNIKDKGCFIIDIGGHKTEIAIVGDDGIISGCSIDVGGDEFNKMIMDYVTDTYKVNIQPVTTEKLKVGVGSMYDNDSSVATVSGRSLIDGKPKSIKITANDIMYAVAPAVERIAETVESVTFMIPDSLAEEIYENGMYLCGGSAQMSGLDAYLTKRLLVRVNAMEDPSDAVANGGANFFYNKDRLGAYLRVSNLK